MTPLANTGVPMLLVQMPLLIVTLPLVILIEAFLCRRWFSQSWKSSLSVTAKANLLSTLVGFPLLWIALVIVQLCLGGGGFPNLEQPWFSIYTVTAQSAWLLPVQNQLYWMIPTASIVLLIPAFFVTIYLEGKSYQKHYLDVSNAEDIKKATIRMHLVSYAFLLLVCLGFLSWAITDKKREQSDAPNPELGSELSLIW